jgi:hydroxymethylpyrimidine pyrophosphatase-like HAD family hydrolase
MSIETTQGLINYYVNNDSIRNITLETKDKYYVTFKRPPYAFDYDHGIYNNFRRPLFKESYKVTVEIIGKLDIAGILKNHNGCYFLKLSGNGWGRFEHKEASKFLAIKEIIKQENMTFPEVLSCGNDINDIEMVKYSGIGISVENGAEELKREANYICGNNNDDGISKWLASNTSILDEQI